MSKRATGVYLKAAKLMEGGHSGGCCAIFCDASPDGHAYTVCDAYKARFTKVFEPPHHQKIGGGYWWSEPPRGRDQRVIALALMAAMVEAGDA